MRKKLRNQKKEILLTLLLCILFCTPLYAGSLTLKTYYPSPITAYDRLRLLPSTFINPPCDVGTLYVQEPDNLNLCINDGLGGTIWDSFSSGDVWTHDFDILSGKTSIYLDGAQTKTDKVGIGLKNPELKLTLDNDGGIFAQGTFNAGETLNTSGAGTRFIWYPRKAAIRAGDISGSQWDNNNIGNYSVAFGRDNQSRGSGAVVTGGSNNTSNLPFGTVRGGDNNKVANLLMFIFPGDFGTISGGKGNLTEGTYATIGGGINNRASTGQSLVLGGNSNQASGSIISDVALTIVGGKSNRTVGFNGTIIGGENNSVTMIGTVGGGKGNQTAGIYDTVGGGLNNRATGTYSNVAGGQSNQTHGSYSTISGGQSNSTTGTYSRVGGGRGNNVSGSHCTIAGGSGGVDRQGVLVGTYDFIGGGEGHQVAASSSAVGGGSQNSAVGTDSLVGGGKNNSVRSSNSVIPGGEDNSIVGTNSWAGGQNTNLSAGSSFAWGHSGTPTSIVGSNYFIIHSGDVGIGTKTPTEKFHVDGGNVKVTGTVKVALNSGVGGPMDFLRIPDAGGTIGYDLAELFETNEDVEVGDLLVIDPEQHMKLKRCTTPYDQNVIGVVSGAPAIFFEGSQTAISPEPYSFTKGTKPPVALSGRIRCKVSLENGPIEHGDLLTSSSLPGHAMRASDIDKAFTSIVGKALESFSGDGDNKKTGIITILVTTQ